MVWWEIFSWQIRHKKWHFPNTVVCNQTLSQLPHSFLHLTLSFPPDENRHSWCACERREESFKEYCVKLYNQIPNNRKNLWKPERFQLLLWKEKKGHNNNNSNNKEFEEAILLLLFLLFRFYWSRINDSGGATSLRMKISGVLEIDRGNFADFRKSIG